MGGIRCRKIEFQQNIKREMIYKQKSQEYAIVFRFLGDGRLLAHCFDDKKRICHIRGKIFKKLWVIADDVVLLCLRSYQESKADLVYKYTTARILKNLKEFHEE